MTMRMRVGKRHTAPGATDGRGKKRKTCLTVTQQCRAVGRCLGGASISSTTADRGTQECLITGPCKWTGLYTCLYTVVTQATVQEFRAMAAFMKRRAEAGLLTRKAIGIVEWCMAHVPPTFVMGILQGALHQPFIFLICIVVRPRIGPECGPAVLLYLDFEF